MGTGAANGGRRSACDRETNSQFAVAGAGTQLRALSRGTQPGGLVRAGSVETKNALHWVLDVAFWEDDQHSRVGNSPPNFAVLRHIALNLLKQETSIKIGLNGKRLKAAWSEAYLLKVLGF